MKDNIGIEAALPILADMGFRRRAGDVFTLNLVGGVVGWLGLNRATRHRAAGEVEINPVVGVRFQEVERLVAECRGENFHSYQPPTISSPLGYVMPDKKFRSWVFGPGRYDQVAIEMTRAISAYGVTFMRSTIDLAELERRLEDGFGFDHQIAYRRPAAALLGGKVDEAGRLLDKEVAAIGTRTDLAADDFRRFAEALRERIGARVPPEAGAKP